MITALCAHLYSILFLFSKRYRCDFSNGKICLSVEIKEDTEKDGFGKVFFNVEYKDGKTSRRVLSDTRIGLETQLMSFTDNIRLKSVSGTN